MKESESRACLPGIAEAELAAQLRAWSEKPFRLRQIQSWLYEKWEFSPEAMLNLPASLRARLGETFGSPRSRVVEAQPGSGGTVKLLLELDDGEAIEMVLIPSPERMTFCLSTQVGCPVRCRFCASGQDGLVRNLRVDEMLEEFYHGVRRHGKMPDNLVFMGIGEGLLNYAALQRTLEVLIDAVPAGFGLSPRRIAVSTSGYVPGMRKFAAWGKPFTLAVSLHAVDDATRARLIPDYCRYPLAEILDAAAEYAEKSGRMVTFEYTLIAGVNDDLAMARELGRMAARLHAKVNLIACNPIGTEFRRPGEERLAAFRREVEASCSSVTLRVEKGTSAASACGQLRARRRDRE